MSPAAESRSYFQRAHRIAAANGMRARGSLTARPTTDAAADTSCSIIGQAPGCGAVSTGAGAALVAGGAAGAATTGGAPQSNSATPGPL